MPTQIEIDTGGDQREVRRNREQTQGRVTMVFIAHQLPKTLLVDSVVRIDAVDAQI